MGKHFVPRKYLAGFATPTEPEQIWMYDKRERSWACAAIGKVAQQRDYFDPETETELAESVERPAHRVLDAVRVGRPISSDERDALALYAAVMLMRVPRRRRKAGELVEPTLRQVIDRLRNEMRAEVSSAEDEVRLQGHLEVLGRIEQQYAIEPPPEVVAKIRSPWPTDRVLAAVRDMAWRLVSTSGPSYFLTSDNPAYFFEAYGVGSPEAELAFPLSSNLMLLGNWQGPKRSTTTLGGTQAMVKEVNRRVASGAERFIFYHQRARWIETLAHRRDPYLSRILWS